MALFLLYIIKSSICLTLFYLFFILVMRSSTFFRFNRMTLLIGTLACLLLPLFPITVSEEQVVQIPMQNLSEILIGNEIRENVSPSVPNEEALTEKPSSASAWNPAFMMGSLYIAGMIITLSLTLFSFFRMWQIIQNAPRKRESGYWLILVPHSIPSFSFAKYIVLSKEDYQTNSLVWLHEQMHVRYRHTWDSLGFILITLFHWFNPVVWLMRLEMQQLHEFEADEGVIRHSIDATQYQLLLVKKAVGTRLYSMANGFNHSKLKKRITMMLKERTNGWERLKLLIAVPVAMGAMILFARPEVKETMEKMTPTVQQDTSQPQDLIAMREFFNQEAEKNKMTLQQAKAGTVHIFCINQRNEILFDGNIITQEDIRKSISEAFINTALKEQQKKKSQSVQSLIINYDINSNEYAVYKYLCEIKRALEALPKFALQVGLNGSQEKWPILVFFDNPRSFKREARLKKYTDIEVTFFEGDKAITLKDFTENDLRDKFVELKRSSQNITHVQLKMNRDTESKEIERIKELLRLLYFSAQTEVEMVIE